MSLLEIFGIGDPKQTKSNDFWKPDPNKGDYRDLKPAHTQVKVDGKDFVDKAAARQYARTSGKTKICPHCYNDSAKRCSCSTCNGTGEVDLYYGVF